MYGNNLSQEEPNDSSLLQESLSHPPSQPSYYYSGSGERREGNETVEESSRTLLEIHDTADQINNNDGDDDDKTSKYLSSQVQGSSPSSSRRFERVYWIDALRIFANFLVIFIHCTGVDLKPTPFKSKNWKILYFYNSLAKPCVPLFIMISGVLFLDPKRPVTYRSLFRKSLPRLLRSYLFWSCYYSVVDDMFINIRRIRYHFSKTLVRDTLKKSILGGGHLWYMNYAMGLYLLTPIFRFLIRSPDIAWYTTGLSVLFAQFLPTLGDGFDTFTSYGFSVGREFIDSLRLTAVGNYINYYMLGYLMGGEEKGGRSSTSTTLQPSFFQKKWWIYTLYAIGWIGEIGTVILRFASCYALHHESGAFSDYNSFNVTMATLGIFIFFKYSVSTYLTPLLRKRTWKKWFLTLSDCSFGIYLIHMSVYHIIYRLGFHPLSFNPLICAPLYSVLVYLLSFVIIYFIRKIPLLRLFT